MVTATKVVVPELPAHRMLVKLSEPVPYTVFVRQSEDGSLPSLEEVRTTRYAAVSIATLLVDRPETAIFPSDEHGNVLDWEALSGIVYGVADFGVAIRAAGWKLVHRPA